jgi:sugar lactone lactonase YvrE
MIWNANTMTRFPFLLLVCLFTPAPASAATDDPEQLIEVVAELDQGPGNITVTPGGDIIVSLHQFFDHAVRVARIEDDGSLTEFAADARLDSVLGLQADANGVVWLLDNAMRDNGKRRLVGWHASEDSAMADIDLSAVSVQGSFLNDLAIDEKTQTAYVADPATGDDAALLVIDLVAGEARRVLQGHISVTPVDTDLIIDGVPVRIRKEDGSEFRPRVGVNPIALDRAGEWLYYGPMHGYTMYRIQTADLRDASLTMTELGERVERWAGRPITDGISIDDAGNLYLGDLARNAIGIIGADRRYRQLSIDPRLSWVDAFSFGPDGQLYAVANQLHRTAVLNGGVNATRPPYLVVRLRPLATGTTGR